MLVTGTPPPRVRDTYCQFILGGCLRVLCVPVPAAVRNELASHNFSSCRHLPHPSPLVTRASPTTLARRRARARYRCVQNQR